MDHRPVQYQVQEPVERQRVHVPADDRGQGSVAGRGLGVRAVQPAGLPGPDGQPGFLRRSRPGQMPQLRERQVDLRLGGLRAPVRQHARGDQPPAGFLQGVMAALGGGTGVLGARLLTE